MFLVVDCKMTSCECVIFLLYESVIGFWILIIGGDHEEVYSFSSSAFDVVVRSRV